MLSIERTSAKILSIGSGSMAYRPERLGYFMRAAFLTLGCKVNQYETEILSEQFASDGFELCDPSEEADVYIVNSCTVTAGGDSKTRQLLKRCRRRNPAAVVALTGCFPQAFPDAAQRLPEADVITGSYNRAGLLDAVKTALATRERVIEIIPHRPNEQFEAMRAERLSGKTRAFVKIEDGCDRYCTYCIIPTARGPVRSKPLDALREELVTLARNGHKEVVLVGINLPSYGRDLGLRLIDAVELACGIDGIDRVRLGSLEPELLTKEDIDRMAAQEKFCPQFHLSLQSGCDETLRRMHRHYTTAEYAAIVDRLRAAFPFAAITTDIMVGFPGETDEEFAESLAFAERIGFAKAHVFAYSRRPGTKAADMSDQITKQIKESRSAKMIAATDRTRLAFMQNQVGTIQPVLFETAHDGYANGYTSNYTPVRVKNTDGLCGQAKYVKIIEVIDEFCHGILQQAPDDCQPSS